MTPSAAAHQKRQTLTVPEAADLLGISRNAAYAAAASGEIPSIRVGRRIVVPVEALQALLRPVLA
ncbi:MAG: helix-turn-helix domain-containing protein [Nocardioides sp.]|uniref:helix-turn-helix domain-containing protein n=1 Tax=Nocardioides sp. TaxID=35761 RepID=UPI0039E52A44